MILAVYWSEVTAELKEKSSSVQKPVILFADQLKKKKIDETLET
jgi:hypothetical protein